MQISHAACFLRDPIWGSAKAASRGVSNSALATNQPPQGSSVPRAIQKSVDAQTPQQTPTAL